MHGLPSASLLIKRTELDGASAACYSEVVRIKANTFAVANASEAVDFGKAAT